MLDAFLDDINIHLSCFKCKKKHVVQLCQMSQSIICSCGYSVHENKVVHIQKIIKQIQSHFR